MAFNWKLELVPIKKLINNSKNPRLIKKDQVQHLASLIEKFGLIDKIIINADYTIIGGHQRIKILKKMKVKEVECWIPDQLLEPEEVDHLCVGLNLNQGSWDYEILANEYEIFDLLAWGFTEEQLLGILDDDEKKEDVEQEKKVKLQECPSCGCQF